MQGILIVDKPSGFTSFDVIAKLRGICKTKKIGHSGTLDPMATGVLPVFIGNAAKAVDMQLNHDKTYLATILLGEKTDTGDITGTVTDRAEVQVEESRFIKALMGFVGAQKQLPPMYSAVKINGQPLYKAARKGQEIERTPRDIIIHNIQYISSPEKDRYTFSVCCSKGTYVRVLCEDIGASLGVPATLYALRRTAAGVYGEENAVGFDAIQKAKDEGNLEKLLLPVESCFMHLPLLEVDELCKNRLLNGALSHVTANDGEYRIRYSGAFLGLATVENGELNVKKLFCERE
ncbi:MAG: tRNA pseudouridine(55) synthase TruB [Oscillospiraceae bacterium]